MSDEIYLIYDKIGPKTRRSRPRKIIENPTEESLCLFTEKIKSWLSENESFLKEISVIEKEINFWMTNFLFL